MNKFFLPTLALAAFIAPASQAQNFSQFERSFEVNGTLQTPEGRRDVRNIAVDLNSNGTATLRLSGRGNGWWKNVESDTNFTGRWYGNGREVTIDLSKVSGRNVFGTATLRFDSQFNNDRDNRQGIGRNSERFDRKRPRLEQISISARSGNNRWDNKTFSGTFEIDDRQNGGGNGGYKGGINDLFTTKRGFGTFRVNGDRIGNDRIGNDRLDRNNETIRSAKVELSRDGDAKITLEGSQTWFFEGNWRQVSRDRIALSLDSSTSAQSIRRIPVPGVPDGDNLGSGEIVLDGLSFESLTLSGRRGRDGFDVSFSTKENAQNGNQNLLADNSAGSGTYKSERGTRKLALIKVRLQRDGDISVRFAGEGKDIILQGQWNRTNPDTYVANVSGTDANGREISGVATIDVKNGDVDDFRFDGRDQYGRCSIRFDARLN